MPACRASCGAAEVHLVAVQEHLARVGDQGAGQRLDQGRLAGPVVADDGQHLAGEQVDVDTVETDHPAEGLDQPAGRQHGLARDRPGAAAARVRRCHSRLGYVAGLRCGRHALTFRIHWSMETATMISTPMASTRNWSSTPARLETDVERVDDQRAQHGADDAAAATEQAGAADHDGGDGLQVGVDDGVRAGRAGPADQHPGGQAVDQPGHRVDAEQHPVDPDADQPRRLDVVPDRVHVPAPGGLAQRERHHQRPAGPRTSTPMVIRNGPIGNRRAHQVQHGRHVPPADAGAARVEQADRGEDAERAQRHDERRQVQPGDQSPLSRPHSVPSATPEEQRQEARHAVVGRQVGHDQHGQDARSRRRRGRSRRSG